MTKTVHDILAELQATMAVPKGRNNEFGGYAYRKAEDIILGARKSAPAGTVIRCTDRLEEIGGQIFLIATASISFAGSSIASDGAAMHPITKKGMDASQITGSASSYARKYALAGLFALDDGTDDPDGRDNRKEDGNAPPPFDPRAAADRIIIALGKRTTSADITALFEDEREARKAIHQANKAVHDELMGHFKKAGEDAKAKEQNK